jgi:hypothetical protein
MNPVDREIVHHCITKVATIDDPNCGYFFSYLRPDGWHGKFTLTCWVDPISGPRPTGAPAASASPTATPVSPKPTIARCTLGDVRPVIVVVVVIVAGG